MKTAAMNMNKEGREPLPNAGCSVKPGPGMTQKFPSAAACRGRILATVAMRLAMLLAVVTSVGCSDFNSTQPVPAEAYVSKPDGTLVPGDVIRVVFTVAPELNTQQRIQPNGSVSLPTIGEVPAAGKSITSLQRRLKSLYQPHLQDSTVTVSLMETSSGVYVSGAVQRPGKIPLYRPLTVMEAVMEAGGFTPMANAKQVVIVRTQQNKSRNYVMNLHQALYGKESTPFYLRSYDVVYVPEKVW